MTKKILIAEDENAIRTILENKLKESGYEVITCINGEECLLSMETNKPDLVLLDIIMPKKDGLELLKEVANKGLNKTIKIIILSNKSDYTTQHEAWFYGVKLYLVKAETSLEDVVAKVKETLAEK